MAVSAAPPSTQACWILLRMPLGWSAVIERPQHKVMVIDLLGVAQATTALSQD